MIKIIPPFVTPDFDACGQLGLCSPAFQRPATFPLLTGLNDTIAGGTNINKFSGAPALDCRPNASLTWVRNNHTFKFGGEMVIEGFPDKSLYRAQGNFTVSPTSTGLPEENTIKGLNGTTGFGYASFLLGAVDKAEVDPPSEVRFGKQEWGFYAQDSWKVTRKLTLDLGIRYDYGTWYKEQYGRSRIWRQVANPVGGHPVQQSTRRLAMFLRQGYPFGFGPRVNRLPGSPKTVLRGGSALHIRV